MFNTAYPRAKPRDASMTPRCCVHRARSERWVPVDRDQRRAVTLTTEGANDDIDRLSRKYDGHDYRSHREDETRVTALLTPEKIGWRGER